MESHVFNIHLVKCGQCDMHFPCQQELDVHNNEKHAPNVNEEHAEVPAESDVEKHLRNKSSLISRLFNF